MSYTYKGFNGYAPLAVYLGEEGWCLACELRPGSQHGQNEFIYFAERVVARAKQLTPLSLLVRLDSGHNAIENRFWFSSDIRFATLPPERRAILPPPARVELSA